MAKKTLFILLIGLLTISSSSCALLLDPYLPGTHHHGHYKRHESHVQHKHYEHRRYDSRTRERRHHH